MNAAVALLIPRYQLMSLSALEERPRVHISDKISFSFPAFVVPLVSSRNDAE